MAVLYVVEQGSILVKKGELVLVKNTDEVLQSVPVFALEQLVLFGNVSLTPSLRNLLLKNQVDTVFMSRSGRFCGRLTSFSGSNIQLRQQQFRKCDDPEFVLATSRRFVEGKLSNSLALLRRHQRRLQDPELARALIRIRKRIDSLDADAHTLDQVRGFEGDGSAAYFNGLSRAIKQTQFRFSKRTRRPPRDPFNALLSFGYTMLLGTVMTAIHTVGLEPHLGFLHAPENGKPSIGLDLMEEFRPILVDALALRSVNRRQFEVTDFEYRTVDGLPEALGEVEDLTPADYPVLLGRLSIRKWLALYNRELEQKHTYPRFGRKLTFRQIITEQARLLARHIKEEEPYRPFLIP